MGKGDKKSRRGKIFMGSYGVKRPRNKKGNAVKYVAKVIKPKTETPVAVAEKPAAKKVVAKKASTTKKAPTAKKAPVTKKVSAKKEK